MVPPCWSSFYFIYWFQSLLSLQKDKVYSLSLPVCFPEVFFPKCVFLNILVLVLLIAWLLFDRVSTGASSAYITEEERANTDAKECLVIYKLSHFTQKNISSECYGYSFRRVCYMQFWSLFAFFLSERLCKVLEYINEVHSLCGVLGINFGSTVHKVHPRLHQNGIEQSRNIGNSTLEGLATTIYKLKAERKSRIHKVFPRFLSLRFKLLSIANNTFPNDPLLTDERQWNHYVSFGNLWTLLKKKRDNLVK